MPEPFATVSAEVFNRRCYEQITEERFRQQVKRLAAMYGWHTWHQYNSQRSDKGWPDVFFAGHGKHFAAELKREKGKLTPIQEESIVLLRASGLMVYVWRPSDIEKIERILKGA